MKACYEIATGNILYTVQDDTIPDEADGRSFAPITEEDARLLSGRKVIDGVVTLVSLVARKTDAVAMLHNTVGAVRSIFVTDLPGQEMIYLDKLTEARAYLVDAQSDLTNYPAIVAELGITADTPYELAQLWLNMSAMWKVVSAGIETIRLSAVSAINVATSEAEIDTVLAAAQSQLEAFI